MEQGTQFKVAAVQACANHTVDSAIKKTQRFIQKAAQNDCTMIVFPYLWLPGIPWFLYCKISTQNRCNIARYTQQALDLTSKAAQDIRDQAQKHNIIVSMGIAERVGASQYISQWTVWPDGKELIERKKAPNAMEQYIFRAPPNETITKEDIYTKFNACHTENVHCAPFEGMEVHFRGHKLVPVSFISNILFLSWDTSTQRHFEPQLSRGQAYIDGPDGKVGEPVEEGREGLVYSTLG